MTGATYDGLLGLSVRGRTWRRRQRPPLSLTVIDRPDHLLVMPADQSGGLRGGDRITTEVEVADQGFVDWRPPSSGLFFPSRDRQGTCTVSTKLFVAAGSRLVWEPPVAIPCAGALVDQAVHIEVEPGGELLYWDGWTDGRTASGERGAFTRLASRLEVRCGARVFRERWSLEGGLSHPLDPAGFQGACQWHVAVAAGPRSAALLRRRIEAWQARGETAEWGELDGLVLGRVLVTNPTGATRAPLAPAEA